MILIPTSNRSERKWKCHAHAQITPRVDDGGQTGLKFFTKRGIFSLFIPRRYIKTMGHSHGKYQTRVHPKFTSVSHMHMPQLGANSPNTSKFSAQRQSTANIHMWPRRVLAKVFTAHFFRPILPVPVGVVLYAVIVFSYGQQSLATTPPGVFVYFIFYPNIRLGCAPSTVRTACTSREEICHQTQLFGRERVPRHHNFHHKGVQISSDVEAPSVESFKAQLAGRPHRD